MPTPLRVRPDACPGVLTPHEAADGALARIRVPGGGVHAAALRVLAGCAEDLGSGTVQLTSRGNLELRGLDGTDPELADRLAAAGLLPSRTHERVRNVLASPLSGVAGGLADVRAAVAELDRAIRARPATTGLPGRFLFAFDDGRGDVAAERPDLCWHALGPATGTLLVAGEHSGLLVGAADAAAVLLEAALAFLALRAEVAGAGGGTPWRAAELPGAVAGITAAVTGPRAEPLTVPAPRLPVPPAPPIGLLPRDDGGLAVGVAPVLGELTAAQLRLLADLAPLAVVTPWRGLVLPDTTVPAERAAARLADAGLIVGPASPALGLSACTGRPGCAKALSDARADAREALAARRVPAGGRVHVAACARRCGAPHATHVDVVAVEGGGYLVDGVWAPVVAA